MHANSVQQGTKSKSERHFPRQCIYMYCKGVSSCTGCFTAMRGVYRPFLMQFDPTCTLSMHQSYAPVLSSHTAVHVHGGGRIVSPGPDDNLSKWNAMMVVNGMPNQAFLHSVACEFRVTMLIGQH
eukprot:5303975-Amphidinium_carterae.1